ncbi:MAG: hypothetical protein JXR68_13020 [Bacteroidales bacterium]|nr:hypothetical protein [Bacteroidales bacterium]
MATKTTKKRKLTTYNKALSVELKKEMAKVPKKKKIVYVRSKRDVQAAFKRAAKNASKK